MHARCSRFLIQGFHGGDRWWNLLRPQQAGQDWYTNAMTLLEIKYALASPLSTEQLTQLSEFANTYGLRKFKLNGSKTELSFEYDASRLLETQVEHVLGQAKIAISKKLN
jgi:hypothetical protein